MLKGPSLVNFSAHEYPLFPKENDHIRGNSRQRWCLVLALFTFSFAVLSYLVMSDSLQPLCPWGFSKQGYWSGLPFPSPGNLPYPGIKPRSPILWADAFCLTSNPTLPLRYCTALHTLSLTSLHLLWFHYYTEFALAKVINYLKLLKPVVSTFVLNLLAFGTEAYFLLPEIPFSCP